MPITSRGQQIASNLLAARVKAVLDCICRAFLTRCPDDPCDDRVNLACFSVKDGRIPVNLQPCVPQIRRCLSLDRLLDVGGAPILPANTSLPTQNLPDPRSAGSWSVRLGSVRWDKAAGKFRPVLGRPNWRPGASKQGSSAPPRRTSRGRRASRRARRILTGPARSPLSASRAGSASMKA